MSTLERVCLDCAGVFMQRTHWGRPEKRCPACMPAHKAATRLASRRTEAGMATRRAAKSRRRARIRGLPNEAIDPIKVFERDKWLCHICKIKTLKAKRGTCHERAPELDHVVSLVDGGGHTWGNVACACRECNRVKGGRSMGQLGLALAA